MTYPPQGEPPQYPSAPPPGNGQGYGNYPGGYQPPPQGQPGNGLAIAALVCGIVGLVLANFILGPLAIIFGGIGLSRANAGARHKGLAIAGLILGVIDIAIFVVVLATVGFRTY